MPALTEKFCLSVPAPDSGVVEFPDSGPGGQRGLVLRVSSGGVRSFAMRWSKDGRRERRTLGRVSEMPLKLARTRAAEIMVAVASGLDHRTVDHRTVGQHFAAWLVERTETGAVRPRVVALDESLWRNHAAGALAFRMPADVTGAHLHRLYAAWAKAGLAANTRRSIARTVRSFFGWLVKGGIIPVSPVPADAPAARERREHVPSLDSLRAVWQWAGSPDAGSGGVCIRLLLLTLCRRREVTGLLWSEVEGLHGAAPMLRLSADRMKGGRVHLVPLSAPAVALIAAQERLQARAPSRFVFPARKALAGGAWLDRPTGAALVDVLKASGVAPGCTIHDFRRGGATALGDAGVPVSTLSLLLGHAPVGITSVYARSDYVAERRAALDLLAGLILLTIPAA